MSYDCDIVILSRILFGINQFKIILIVKNKIAQKFQGYDIKYLYEDISTIYW